MERKIKYGIIHCHSENSLKDSTMKIKDLVNKCGELGTPAIVLTDHGTLTGALDLFAEVNDYNKKYDTKMKAIPGVEVYCILDDISLKREHLCLIPKNNIGYRAISKAVTESYSNIVTTKGGSFPIVNWDILNKYFGEGAEGHGNVFATSACMTGVIAVTLLRNHFEDEKIKKINEKVEVKKLLPSYNPEKLNKIKDKLNELCKKRDNLNEDKKVLTSLAKKTFVSKQKKVEKLKGTPDYEKKFKELEEEIAESKSAEKELPSIKEEVAKLNQKISATKKTLQEYEKGYETVAKLESEISKIENNKVSDDVLYKEAEKKAEKLINLFGVGNFVFELQFHGIPEESYVFPKILEIAKKYNSLYIATNDAHMATSSADDIKAREIVRSLRYETWFGASDADKELYIKTDDELINALSKIISKEDAEIAVNNIENITSNCLVTVDTEPHYPKFKSPINDETSEECIRRKCKENISWRFPNISDFTDEYQKRLDYELDVICKMGYADYHLVVQDFLEYGRLVGKVDLDNPPQWFINNPYNIELLKEKTKNSYGISIGPGRGSAVGSLVCYLLGITSIDPIKYHLIFERFLNVERVSMPDIDSDFRPDVRELAINYVKYKYGENAVCCIMTKGTNAAKAAVRNAARALGYELGGVKSEFIALGDSISKAVPNDIGIKLDDCYDKLMEQFGSSKLAVRTINNAKLIEGTFMNIGMHAAGVVIADNGNVSDYLPLLYNSDKKQWCCQCVKEQVEEVGLLKFDFLGLRNLGILNETQKSVAKEYGKVINLETLPMDDKNVFKNIFSTGNTNSVFQFESAGMKQMLRQFKPENIEDIILLVAAYRPGPLQFLNDIIEVKHGRKVPNYIIPELENVLGKTYGYPIYQEQIMEIFNKFAGFSLGESDIIRRYMSKKKTDKFMAYKDKFIDGFVSSGANLEDAETFWEQLVSFSKYAFNKSHAAAYAFVAYYTAYFKYYYPKEYLCAVMNSDIKLDKIGPIIADCKNCGIKVFPPDVNASQVKFSFNEKGIVFGLSLVKEVNATADKIINDRKLHGPFTSYANFVMRTACDKGTCEALAYAGAFDAFTHNRKAIANVIPTYSETIKKYYKKLDDIKEKENKLYALKHQDEYNIESLKVEGKTVTKFIKDNQEIIFKCSNTEKALEKEINKQEKTLEKANLSLQELLELINAIDYDKNGSEDTMERLNKEKEYTSSFISGHPLDAYDIPDECITFDNAVAGQTVAVCGLISDFKIRNRKKDNAEMGFFTLEDSNGQTMQVSSFVDAYAKYKQYLDDDKVIIVKGKIIEEEFNDEKVLKLVLSSAKSISKKVQKVLLEVNSLIDWTENIYPKVKYYGDKNGYKLFIHDNLTGFIRETKLTVNSNIFENENFVISKI